MMCWTGGVINRVLQNEIYTGAVVSLKSTMDSRKGKLVARPKAEWVRVEGMHEAIVTKEEFRRVQEMTEEIWERFVKAAPVFPGNPAIRCKQPDH